jgi:hypothetical protein
MKKQKSPRAPRLDAAWIWTDKTSPNTSRFVRFRAEFSAPPGAGCHLSLSADSRHWVWINGNFAGFGPVRGWPRHWHFDILDILRWLAPGRNVVAVLVNHWADGNFQYINSPPGLCAQIVDASDKILCKTGPDWLAAHAQAEREDVPRICVQEAFEEHYDARLEDGWRLPGYKTNDDWRAAVIVPASHPRMTPRPIPFLGGGEARPARLLAVEEVSPAQATWNIRLKPCFAPGDHSSRFCFVRGFLTTLIYSRWTQEVTLVRPHHHDTEFWLNGQPASAVPRDATRDVTGQRMIFRRGWNRLLFPWPGYNDIMAASLPAGGVHLPVFVLAVRAKHALRWACRGGAGDLPWAFAGPFPLAEDRAKAMRGHVDFPRVVQAEHIHPDATDETARAIPGGGEDRWRDWSARPWFQPVAPAEADSFASSCGDEVTRRFPLPDSAALISGGDAWELPLPGPGRDMRILLDFGKMLVGNIAFTVDASAGATLDFHLFEFIQPDGRHNLATGMNNSMRYTCREGAQSFRSLQRRGFRFMHITFRHLVRPPRIYDIKVAVSTYPQRRAGHFACSDEQLNRIWEVGADTLRWCAEDTYTDCPTYEQTHWAGDARNEGLVDWVANGDPRLWHHCLLQAGRSLERSPIVESHAPSSWDNILPAFSFLWMRSVREYYEWTGDKAGAMKLYPWLRRNIQGLQRHLTKEGLFRIHA